MEEKIEQIRQKIKDFWTETDNKKKLKLGGIALGVLLILTFLILKITQTKYDVLYKDLSLKDMGQITSKLDEMNVDWKAGDDQSSILVPTENKNKIKIELATYGLPKDGYTYADAFSDSTWTMTDYDKKQRFKQARQSDLAQTIGEIEGVQSAKVFIEEKEITNFVLNNDDRKTTASVFIVKSDNRGLNAEKVKAIKNLVASSISMDPENVTITDEEGRLLTDNEENDFMTTDQFAMKESLETKINYSIRKFLSNVYGGNNVDVMSSVKINMDSERTTIVEFAPSIEGNEEGLIRSMEEIEEHMQGGAYGDIPGYDANSDNLEYQMDEGNLGSRYDKVSRIINHELDEINKEIRKAPGQVESITVAVLINKDSLPGGELTQEKEEEITNLIYAATGLDTKQVKVIAEKFNLSQEEGFAGESIAGNNLALIIGGIIALVLLAIGVIIFLRRRAEEEERKDLEKMIINQTLENEESIQDIDFNAEDSKMKEQIDKFVDLKPDSVAQLLRNWLNE